MVFNFPLMRTERLSPAWVRANQAQRLAELAAVSPQAWPCNTLGNHDTPRVFNNFGDGLHDQQLARLSLALMLTLRGSPFLYFGEEIGMTDLKLEEIGQFRDRLGVWLYQAQMQELGRSPAEALDQARKLTRDKCRTPMQWSNSPNAGFCPAGVDPWLPVNPNFSQGVNVLDQLGDSNSLLEFYRALLRLRKATPALIAGDYVDLLTGGEVNEHMLAFLRRTPAQTCLVTLNYSGRSQVLDLAQASLPTTASLRLIFSSRAHPHPQDVSTLQLAPFEIYIAELLILGLTQI